MILIRLLMFERGSKHIYFVIKFTNSVLCNNACLPLEQTKQNKFLAIVISTIRPN
jgi:hypothetical protein